MNFLAFLLLAVIVPAVWSFNISAVLASDKKYYLLYNIRNHLAKKAIPDEHTVRELWFDPPSLKVMEDSELKLYLEEEPVPSLIKYAVNPDEVLRVAVQRAKALNPITFKITPDPDNLYKNPSIVKHEDRVLMAWTAACSGKPQPLDPNEKNFGEVKFSWLEKGSYMKRSNETLYGIGPDFSLKLPNPGIKFFEDPRPLFLSNGSLLVTHGAMDINSKLTFVKNIITYSEETKQLSVSSNVVAYWEKNWISFEHDKKIYYIRSVDPLVISELQATENGDAIADVVKDSEINLPWNAMYRDQSGYRGSGSAVMVRGVLLAFMHTKCVIMPGQKRFTYFMGAFTLCPNYPFHVHSITPFPIVDSSWYDGPWLSLNFDYVVYPAGLVVSEDEKTVYVSFGYQNSRFSVLEFDVDELFESMQIVRECNAKPVATATFH